jgi:hypothetical protein
MAQHSASSPQIFRVPSNFGIDLPEDPLIQDILRRDFSSVVPGTMAQNMQMVANMIEQIQVTTRDNNAIMFQLLGSLEERMNRKMESMKAELTLVMEQKLENMAAMHAQQIRELEARIASSSSVSTAGQRRESGHAAPRRASTLPSASTTGSLLTDSDNKSVLSTIEEEIRYDMVSATPNAGFVIKTRKLLGTKEKVFINVFHHELVDLEPPSSARNFTADNKPFLVIGDISHSLDKEGTNRTTYNVCVSSEYFKIRDSAETELKITSPQAIVKIIHKINLKYTEFLDENGFSLPKVANGYIGDEIQPMQIPVPVKSSSSLSNRAPFNSFQNGQAQSASAIRPTNGNALQPRISFSDIDGGITRVSEEGDTNSVVSELTTDNMSTAGTKRGNSMLIPRRSTDSVTSQGIAAVGSSRPTRRIQRKSVFDVSSGRRLINSSMLEYVKDECVDMEAADSIILRSAEDPAVLLGWQIELKEGENKGIYVVTDVKKNMMSKSEFRLSSAAVEDLWVKLKRSEGKSGLEFRPLRKVLFALGGDESDNLA